MCVINIYLHSLSLSLKVLIINKLIKLNEFTSSTANRLHSLTQAFNEKKWSIDRGIVYSKAYLRSAYKQPERVFTHEIKKILMNQALRGGKKRIRKKFP